MPHTQTLELRSPSGEVTQQEVDTSRESIQKSFSRVQDSFQAKPNYQGSFLEPSTDGKARYAYIGSLDQLLAHYHAWGFEGVIPEHTP